MISISQDTWEKLERPVDDKLIARFAFQETTRNLLCALDAKGNRHLLIPLQSDNTGFIDKQSRGVSVDTRELTIQGKTPKKYIDIECLDSSGYSIFDLIGGEIVSLLVDETKQPDKIVRHVLARWRHFWGQVPHSMLAREEQIGLFAELWFLCVWLFPKFGPDIVIAWRGPWGSRHDFEWSDKSVEVKGTTNARGRIHKIHGVDQLSNPETGPVYLLSVRLREERGAENTLPRIIEICRRQLVDSEDALAHFENALVRAGYSPAYEDEYAKLPLRVLEDKLFQVTDDFPRLTPEKFVRDSLLGVEKVDYEINLNTFDHLIVASRPDQVPF